MCANHEFLGGNSGELELSNQTGNLPVWEYRYSKNKYIPLHEHDVAYFCFFFQGKVLETDGRQETVFSRNRLVFQPKGRRHAWRVGPQGTRLLGFEIDDTLLHSRFGECALPNISVELSDRRLYNLLHKVMLHSRGQFQSDDQSNWPYEVLANLIEDQRDDGQQWMPIITEYIHDNFRDNPTPRTLGTLAHRHPAHLMRAFRQITGNTIGEYIRSVKIEYACRQIRKKNIQLTEIAHTCGFADQSHFIRVFREFMNVTPAVYQRAFS